MKALGEGSKRNDIWSRITLHAVVFAVNKWVTPLYVYKAKGKDKLKRYNCTGLDVSLMST